MTGDGTGTGTYTYTWSAEGRMTSAIPNGGGSTTFYVYNALGQRAEKAVGTTYSEYAFDAFGQALGYHNRTAWTEQLVPAGATPIVKYKDSTTYFLHSDRLGSTGTITNASGAETQNILYYPWGQRWAYTGTIKDERFASLGQRDTETANDPTLFRADQARLGRWMSPDPLGGDVTNPQSLNRYAYVMNNPTNLTDPSGLDPCDTHPNTAGCNHDPHFNDAVSTGFGGSCYVDGLSTSCGIANGLLSMGAACIGSCTTSVVASNGQTYQIVQTAGPTVYEHNGDELGDESIAELGLSPLDGSDFGAASSGSAPGGGPGRGGTAGCTARILGALNTKLGTSFTSANVTKPFNWHGAVNLVVQAEGLTTAQFNAIQPGNRWALSTSSAILGYGPSLHIPRPHSFADPLAEFANSNIGGQLSALFTAHIDSAHAFNPVGFVLHIAIDVAGRRSRNPCP